VAAHTASARSAFLGALLGGWGLIPHIPPTQGKPVCDDDDDDDDNDSENIDNDDDEASNDHVRNNNENDDGVDQSEK